MLIDPKHELIDWSSCQARLLYEHYIPHGQTRQLPELYLVNHPETGWNLWDHLCETFLNHLKPAIFWNIEALPLHHHGSPHGFVATNFDSQSLWDSRQWTWTLLPSVNQCHRDDAAERVHRSMSTYEQWKGKQAGKVAHPEGFFHTTGRSQIHTSSYFNQDMPKPRSCETCVEDISESWSGAFNGPSHSCPSYTGVLDMWQWYQAWCQCRYRSLHQKLAAPQATLRQLRLCCSSSLDLPEEWIDPKNWGWKRQE